VEEIIKDVNNDDDMVQKLLDLNSAADTTISTAFLTNKINAPETSAGTKTPDSEFVYSLKDAFASGFRARRNKPAEMIAKFLDKAMRKGQGSATDAEFQALLNSVLALYRYTDDKDVFRTFYHRSLAKRLLLEKSASIDFEASMLKKLKEGTCTT
jgi:cullin-4